MLAYVCKPIGVRVQANCLTAREPSREARVCVCQHLCNIVLGESALQQLIIVDHVVFRSCIELDLRSVLCCKAPLLVCQMSLKAWRTEEPWH